MNTRNLAWMSSFLLLCSALLAQTNEHPGSSPAATDIQDYREDLEHLVTILRSHHADPTWAAPDGALADSAAQARIRLAECSSETEARVELMRVIASLRDGHTALDWTARTPFFGDLPIRVDWFEGELRIVRAQENLAHLLGAEIRQIGVKSVTDALTTLESIVPHASDQEFRRFCLRYIHLPGLLHASGITMSPARVTMEIVDTDLIKRAVTLPRVDTDHNQKVEMVDVSEICERPLVLDRHRNLNFWLEWLPQYRTVYVRLAAIAESTEERFLDFTRRVFETVEDRDASQDDR